jgi:hypothetical protein
LYIIQKLTLPDPELSNCHALYFRTLQERSHTSSSITLAPNQSLSTDTFFNAFSISPWVEASSINEIFVNVRLTGKCRISIRHLAVTQGGGESELETEIQVSELTSEHPNAPVSWTSLPISIRNLQKGLLFVRLTSLDENVLIHDVTFGTKNPPQQNVKLGIVITTFNRQAQTLSAIQRLTRSIGDLPERERSEYRILVMDNGKSLDFTSNTLCEVIPNANIGGTGGFMRGLLELQDRGSYTHCIFMDDDASCHFESIARTKRLFEYATLPRLAVTGSMLLDNPSYLQHEFTAYVDKICQPRLSKLDLREQRSLLKNDLAASYLAKRTALPNKNDTAYTYGGWWFFAFALNDVSCYSFPFFVRGDDVFFSIHNDFSVLAVNGIASWQESFAFKNSPITIYLSVRSEFAQIFLLPRTHSFAKLIICLWLTYWTVVRYLFAFNYALAKASLLAIEDFLRGPDFWFENLEFSRHLKSVSQILNQKTERRPELKPIKVHDVRKQNFLIRVLRLILLNGHLLPTPFRNKELTAYEAGSHLPASLLFRQNSYAIQAKENSFDFFVYRRDLNQFLSLITKASITVLRLIVSFYPLYRSYTRSKRALSTPAPWRKVFESLNNRRSAPSA